MNWIDFVSKILQAIFFITIAAVAVLTYLRAKRTLLQPIRTEVFKEQLRIINEVSSHFIGKTESDLRKDLDFGSLISINAIKMMDEYISLFFDKKFDLKERPYSDKNCPSSIATEDALTKADFHLWPESPNSDKTPDARTKAAIWSNYKFQITSLTKTHCVNYEKLQKLTRSPLLPTECAKLVDGYLRIVFLNVILILEVLTAVSKELPEKYPNEETLKKASLSWIHNRYNEEFKDLEPLAREIETFLRTYLGTDSLILS